MLMTQLKNKLKPKNHYRIGLKIVTGFWIGIQTHQFGGTRTDIDICLIPKIALHIESYSLWW